MAQVMREAQSVDFGTPQSVGVAQDGTSYKQPDYTKYEGSAGRLKTSTDVGSSSLSQLVGTLGKAAANWGEQKIKTSQEEAYLSGQAAAAAGDSAASVQSNIFTKDWATAGWSDTKARLGMADADAQTAVDMQKLKEQDPEKMKEYLSQRRESLMPLMQGMSMEARKGMMGQMLLSDQHAIATHLGEHQKFIVDQQSKAIQTSFSVANDAMNASKADPLAYETATNSAIANLWGNVWSNPNLPTDMKQKLVEQAASLALENNNETLYEKLRDAKDPSGISMIDQLPFNSQVSLAKAYQSSKKDTATMRNSNYNTQLGLYESKLDNPLADPVSWEDHQAMVQQGVQIGVISGDKQAALAKTWADSQARKQKATTSAAMYAAGDINGMFGLGVTEDEGAQAWIATQQRKGISPGDAVANLAQIGLTTGQPSAFSMVGKLMRSSISAIGTGQDIDPGQLAGVNTVLDVIGKAEKKGNLSARTSFLSSFDDDTQARLMTYWDGLKQGKAPNVAAADAATAATENATLSKSDKAALAQQQSKENSDLVSAISPKGLFAQAWEKVVPDAFRFQDNVNKDKLRAGKSWFEDPERVEAAQAKGKVALLQELNDISRTHPYMSAEGRQSLALTRVANRTLTTDGGPLVLPQGQNVQTFFGVDGSVSPDIVSSTLNTLHEPAKGNRTVYQVNAGGQLQWQEFNNDGALVNGGGTFDPKSVQAAVRAQQDKQTEKYAMTDGAGKIVKGSDGSQVQYNGNNTLGIGTNVALQVRDDLVKYEGVRQKPYDDASGKVVNGKRVTTAGVGVSSHNEFYPPVEADGTVSPVNISRSFMRASDQAMKKANTEAIKLPQSMQNPTTMRLFSQLAYQGGSLPSDMTKAMQSGNREDAMKALTDSPQYKMAHTDRRVFYTDLMRGIMPVTY